MAIASCIMLCVMSGCATGPDKAAMVTQIEKLETGVTQAKAILDTVQKNETYLRDVVASLPEGEQKAKAQAMLNKTLGVGAEVNLYLTKAEPALAALKEQVKQSTDTLDVLEAVGSTATKFLPDPWSAVAGGVLGLFVGLWRAFSKQKTAAKVIQSVQPIVDAAIKADSSLATTLNRLQGKDGRALVDKVQSA
jgi:hypothetical protein